MLAWGVINLGVVFVPYSVTSERIPHKEEAERLGRSDLIKDGDGRREGKVTPLPRDEWCR